jgi:hypothetical protein
MKTVVVRSIIIDFEAAAISAFVSNFGVEICGCFFHFTQIIWRKLQADGQVIQYRNDQNFKFKVVLQYWGAE